MTDNTYHNAWRRILSRAGVPHVGTHGICHRAATDIANSGIPLKVGMALTAHTTVAMFMRYIHNEDDPVRMAADVVAARRRNVIGGEGQRVEEWSIDMDVECEAEAQAPEAVLTVPPPAGLEDGRYTSRTKVGNYRPFRHRSGANRDVPPGTRGGRGHDECQTHPSEERPCEMAINGLDIASDLCR